MDQQDQIVAYIFVGADHTVIKFLQEGIILQLAVTKLKEKFLGAAFKLCICRKLQIQQILANASGKSFPEQFKIFEDFFFRKRKKCFLKISFFILFTSAC